jgi:hypothetical protein
MESSEEDIISKKVTRDFPEEWASNLWPSNYEEAIWNDTIPVSFAFSLFDEHEQDSRTAIFERCVADLTKFCFSHGHLNVALSRITDPANMAIFVNDGDWDQNENRIWTINVVYKQILNAVV